jgi:hypothetical protein
LYFVTLMDLRRNRYRLDLHGCGTNMNLIAGVLVFIQRVGNPVRSFLTTKQPLLI